MKRIYSKLRIIYPSFIAISILLLYLGTFFFADDTCFGDEFEPSIGDKNTKCVPSVSQVGANKTPYLLIAVISSASNFEIRHKIRASWNASQQGLPGHGKRAYWNTSKGRMVHSMNLDNVEIN